MWFKETRFERMARLMKSLKPRKKTKRVRTKPLAKKRKWTWDGDSVWAFDKSEARSLFKTKHGLKRLPVGAVVEVA